MKKLIIVSLFLLSLSIAMNVHAQEQIRNQGIVSVKLDYLKFTDGDVKRFGPEYGPYIGLDAYALMRPAIFLGGEIGYFSYDSCGCVYAYDSSTSPTVCDVDKEITYIPIEVNVKYALTTAIEHVFVLLGAGVSYNYAAVELSYPGRSFDESDWLIGAQVSLDVHYETGRLFFGLNGKYQITEQWDLKDLNTDANFNNVRVGGQIGIRF